MTLISFLAITSPQLSLGLDASCSVGFVASFVMSCWAYYETVTSDPRGVPGEYHPDNFYKNFSTEEKKLKRLYRFCKRGSVFKPDRAHSVRH